MKHDINQNINGNKIKQIFWFPKLEEENMILRKLILLVRFMKVKTFLFMDWK